MKVSFIRRNCATHCLFQLGWLILLQAPAWRSLSCILVLDLRGLVKAFAVLYLLVEVDALVDSLEAFRGRSWHGLVLEAASCCTGTHNLPGVWHIVGALSSVCVRCVYHANSRRGLQLFDGLPVCLVLLLLLVGGSDLVLHLVLLIDVCA